MRRAQSEVLVLALLAGTWGAGAQAQTSDDAPAANPARPTVATPATLTPVGYLQFENGVLYGQDSPEFSSLVNINQVTKLTVHPRLEFLMESAPFVHSGMGTDRQVSVGDVLAGTQVVLLPGRDRRPTISVSYFGQVYPSDAPDVDIGTPYHSLLLLASGDLRGFHFDANAFFNEQTQGGVGRAQFGQTISVSHSLKRFTIAGELWHFTQPFLRSNAAGNLWAISYALRPNLVIDAGFQRGLTRTSTQWEAVAGFTYLLPQRLWKKK